MNSTVIPPGYDDYEDGLNLFYYGGDIDDIRKPWIQEPHFIPTVVVYGITFLFGIIGNTLVIAAIAVEVNSRTNTTLFLVSLAVSDLLFLIICVPYETASYFIANWNASDFLCRFSGFAEMLSAISSVLNLTVVSIER